MSQLEEDSASHNEAARVAGEQSPPPSTFLPGSVVQDITTTTTSLEIQGGRRRAGDVSAPPPELTTAADAAAVPTAAVAPGGDEKQEEASLHVFGFDITKKQAQIVSHLFLVLNQVLYAVYAVWSQWTLKFLPTEFLLFARLLSATVQIWSIAQWFDAKSIELRDKTLEEVWGERPWLELLKLWIFGGLNFVLNIYVYLLGIKYTNAVVATVAQCAVPVITAILAIAVKQDPFSWLQMLGLALAIGGNVVQLNVWEASSTSSSAGSEGSYGLGIAMIVLNVTSYSIFLVGNKRYMRSYPMPMVYRHQVTVGVLGTLVICLVRTDIGACFRSLPSLDPWALWGFIFAVVVMAYVPYATVGVALRCNVPAPLIAAHIIYQPVFVSIIGAFVLGTVLKPYQYVGGVVAATAVGLTTWVGLRNAEAAAAATATSVVATGQTVLDDDSGQVVGGSGGDGGEVVVAAEGHIPSQAFESASPIR